MSLHSPAPDILPFFWHRLWDHSLNQIQQRWDSPLSFPVLILYCMWKGCTHLLPLKQTDLWISIHILKLEEPQRTHNLAWFDPFRKAAESLQFPKCQVLCLSSKHISRPCFGQTQIKAILLFSIHFSFALPLTSIISSYKISENQCFFIWFYTSIGSTDKGAGRWGPYKPIGFIYFILLKTYNVFWL